MKLSLTAESVEPAAAPIEVASTPISEATSARWLAARQHHVRRDVYARAEETDRHERDAGVEQRSVMLAPRLGGDDRRQQADQRHARRDLAGAASDPRLPGRAAARQARSDE